MTATSVLDVAGLERFFDVSGIHRAGPLSFTQFAGGKSNLTFRVTDGVSSWVVRRPPASGLTPSAHDMSREWTVMSALQNSAVPVPPTIVFDADGEALGAPMTVTAFVPGRAIRTGSDLGALTDAEVTANARGLVDVLVDIHAVNLEEVGLTKFGRHGGFIQRQIALWDRQWGVVKTRELPDLERLRSALADRTPEDSATTLIHGDYRVDNTIINATDAAKVEAVVDWELSTLGDPLTDLALVCSYRQPLFDIVLGDSGAWTSPRYPSPETFAQWYAASSGRDIRDWPFYLALANYKIAVIAEGIAYRALTAGEDYPPARSGTDVPAEFVTAGLQAIAGRR